MKIYGEWRYTSTILASALDGLALATSPWVKEPQVPIEQEIG
jgi:hypothetical protein